MAIVSNQVSITAANAGRVDRVVQARTGRSRSEVRGLIQHDCVRINGAICASDFEQVKPGDTVTVIFDPQQRYPERNRGSAHAPFRLLFEDDHLLVVDKAAHLLTVPTPKREKDTLVHRLQSYISRGRKHRRHVAIVHRLDRGVSGVLVFAKSEAVAEALRQQFAEAKPDRQYVALVAGWVKEDRGTFDKWLVADKQTIHRQVSPQAGVGERAVTHFVVEKRGDGITRVRIRLETGRRNQIRIHFSDAGHPVLGDPRYESDKARHRRWRYNRMALHAAVLGFIHPVTGRRLRFEAPEPKEFSDVLP
jgi:23S rRNA pseudouridine1911/1915/1917 synthase